jgi:heterodisulfide reductase subunit C
MGVYCRYPLVSFGLQYGMQIAQQILFILLLAGMGYVIYTRIQRIIANVRLGRAWLPEPVPAAERWQKVAVFALGQKKMFEKPLVAVMHFVIYASFFIINIEILEIILDGILGTHRLFAPLLGSFYGFVINFFEWLALGTIVVCIAFLTRRNVLNLKRFHARELTAWPRNDANIILGIEIVLMMAFLTWNGSETVLRERAMAGLGSEEALHHYNVAGIGAMPFAVSGWIADLFAGWSVNGLIAYERIAWWLHITGILAFGVYVTYSKHLHIGMAFPTIYWGRTRPKGQVRNMDDITTEVRAMLGLPAIVSENIVADPAQASPPQAEPVGKFGARDVTDLSWKNLMEAYSCTECGRCTEQCPANITGKLLSPRKIMMDTRDRMEEIGRAKAAGTWETDKAVQEHVLLDNFTTREELLACTTCQACVSACPVNLNPLDIIYEMRRYAIMEESKAPQSWNAMFQNLETQQAPWAYPASDRLKWMEQN